MPDELSASRSISPAVLPAGQNIQADLRLGLALSGGGLRATLFHLGVIKYLRDVGLLSKVTHICSVSGGSILAAHLVQRWAEYLEKENYDDGPAQELIRFAESDLRCRVFRRAFSIVRLMRWEKWSPTRWLEYYYSRELYQSQPLSALMAATCTTETLRRPELHILATDLETGVLCSFSHQGLWYNLHDADQNLAKKAERDLAKIADQPIGLAVAASSAFPLVFRPVYLTPQRVGRKKDEFFGRDEMFLTDGGVYDNLALVPFVVRNEAWKCDLVLASDASRVSDWATLRGRWTVWKHLLGLQRSYEIASDLLYKLEKDCLEKFSGAGEPLHWVNIPIYATTAIKDVSIPVEEQLRVKDIRTDLDRFPSTAIRALVVHGQCVAQQAVTEIDAGKLKHHLDSNNWKPWDPRGVAGPSAKLRLPSSEYRTLTTRRRCIFSHCSWRDWPNYVHLGVLLILILVSLYWWWSALPQKPRDLRIVHVSRFETVASGEYQWLHAYQVQAFREATSDKDAGTVDDVQLVRMETNGFEKNTPEFGLAIRLVADFELRAQIFLVRDNTGRPFYLPLLAVGGEPPPINVLVPNSQRGDFLLIVGQMRAKGGKQLSRDVDKIQSVLSLEVK